MADKLITIAAFEDSIEASLAKQLLDSSGIKSILSGENAANVYSGLSAIAHVELQVFEDNAEQALEILKSHEDKEQ